MARIKNAFDPQPTGKMHSRFGQCLVLLCGLLLVPPPGWCCLVSRAAHPDKPKKSCCGCPLCKTAGQPAPAPMPEQRSPTSPDQCPCFDRTSMLPAAAESTPTGAAMTTPSFALVPRREGSHASRPEPATARLPHPGLYLVYCTWLC